MSNKIKNFEEQFIKVTEAAALETLPWIGRGNKIAADNAGTSAMRRTLNRLPIETTVVIGEGEMDEAPMLYIGEKLGKDSLLQLDLAVDPIEGTTLVAKGMNDAMAVLAVAPKDTLLRAPDIYMKKIACGKGAKGAINLADSLTVNMHRVAKALNKNIKDLTVMIQDRPRHEEWVQEVLLEGARVKLFHEVDITGVLATSLEHCEVDLFIGVGGAPEGVIAAVAQKNLGGDFQGMLVPDEAQYDRCVSMGIEDPHQIWTIDELVKSDESLFCATGITDGLILNGVKTVGDLTKTHSLVVESNTHQFVVGEYNTLATNA